MVMYLPPSNPLNCRIMNFNKRGDQTMLEQDVNGVPHVLVPKEEWDRIWEVFDRISEMGE